MKRWYVVGFLAVAIIGLSGAVSAQQTVDANRLGVDVARIQRQLKQAVVREERDGVKLRFAVDVYGQAPPIVLFNERDNLRYGRAPYGSPTHQEMLEMMTPKEYRAPVADFSSLVRWLSDKSKK